MKATATYIFCFSMLLTSCNAINFGSGDLETNLNLEEKKITNVQEIEAIFTVRNNTSETKEYGFSSGCQVSFLITKGDTKIIRSEENLFCTMALTSFKLEKDESKTFELPTYFDIDLKSGTYSIKAYLIGYEDEVYATKSFSVN
ncbi:MAG TPA: hypothetical protein DCL80_11855 [Balneola sp.]|jgi:hypothetical protein|nr:hypothetical protein [Balneola sp.]MAO77401.1 hypothetical protein [Balneola sp.]MBF65359.1 hypothetical protein [Balneola sp.]HAH51897.1 hypothetical protein [Balneola sp.]HAW78545.1 hypothetical protein [Balneola sp.]|tara:strand:- start:250 stop:681 length:432 start_codon:yes stop_codon:yes gene_type:complete